MSRPVVFFDLEATDTNPATARIAEISMVKVDLQRYLSHEEIIDKISFYVNPTVPMSPGAVEVTGITDELLAFHPPFSEVASVIANFISGCDLAGHNIMGFDLPLLAEELLRAGHHGVINKETRFIDTLKNQSVIMPRTLGACYKHYTGLEMDDKKAHGAEYDTEVAKIVFACQVDNHSDVIGEGIEEYHKIATNGKQIVDFAGKLALNENRHIVYNFGKNINKTITSDRQYAEWMLKSDFTLDTKMWIKHALNFDSIFDTILPPSPPEHEILPHDKMD